MKVEFYDKTEPKQQMINEKIEYTPVNTFDLSPFDELDPIMNEGFKLFLSSKSKADIIYKNQSITQIINIRLFYKGEEYSPSIIKLEISTEDDVFFYYLATYDNASFRKLQEKQGLKCNFPKFLSSIKTLIESTDDKIQLKLNENDKENINLEFIKILSHKYVTALTLEISRPSYQFLKKMISYRFNYLKGTLAIYDDRIKYVSSYIQEKNPTLYKHVLKTPGKLTEEYIKSKQLNY